MGPVNFEDVLERAAARGVDLSGVVIGRQPNQVPEAPSHRWVVFPASDGGTVIGGMDRGRFVPYAEFTDLEGAADALAHLTVVPPAPPAPRPMPVLVSATLALFDQLHAAFREQPVLSGTVITPGAPLDHIGTESGHCLYLLNTPMSQRSLPPTDLTQPRTGYVVTDALPAEASVERVPPWFGQPGGGVLVRLPRVISYYVDVGLLLRFDPSLEGGPSVDGARADDTDADQ